jgi:dipeptidase D
MTAIAELKVGSPKIRNADSDIGYFFRPPLDKSVEELRGLSSGAETPLRYFRQLNQIPRGSFNGCDKSVEDGVREYLKKFAEVREFEFKEDDAGNLVIFVPGKGAQANKPAIAIQSHMDMVRAKNSDSDFNFDTDPIEVEIRKESNELTHNEEVLVIGSKNRKTTLGIDNGGGLCMALAVVDELDSHPPLYLVFTSLEEIGLIGASKFNIPLNSDSFKDAPQAEYLINLDSEEEGEITVGCACGERRIYTVPVDRVNPISEYSPIEINLSGFLGGHSGMVIHEKRGNPLKALNDLIFTIKNKKGINIQLSGLECGEQATNIIPDSAKATLWIHPSEKDQLLTELKWELDRYLRIHKIKTGSEKPSFTIIDCDPDSTIKPLTHKSYLETFLVINGTKDGMFKERINEPGLPFSSNNLAIVKSEDDSLKMAISYRSQSANGLTELVSAVEKEILILSNIKVDHGAGYVAWEEVPSGKLYHSASEAMNKVFGYSPKKNVTHGGLECGALLKQIPEIKEAISFGFSMWEPHTVNEAAWLDSIGRGFRTLCRILKDI